MAKVCVTYDSQTDTLRAFFRRAKLVTTRYSEEDPYLLLTFDYDYCVSMISVVGASKLGEDDWEEHPERPYLPIDLFDAVNSWIQFGVRRVS